ncbi:MAG: M1 family metallopeptidase [Chitinophagaceae bacterium]|nr:M1 family metallopeptidase [Chitinophagaceae bacterium]
MRKLFVLIACCFSLVGFAQTNYWQQEVNYTIAVSLNDKSHSLNGNVSMEYINHSPDTLSFIYFHLWPNAYKNETTALATQLNSDKENKKKLNNAQRGFIDSLHFKVNGQVVLVEKDPQYIDVIKLSLASPLLPGQSINIATPFYVKLPSYFSRSGYDEQQYMVCQWYPKPAVYDRKGWHAFPYLDQGEFYSEFGTFKVSITVPSAYIIGATGILRTESELVQYKTIGAENYKNRKAVSNYKPADPKSTKTLEYFAEKVHDFAWFADKDFVIQYDTLQLASGRMVDVFSYYQPNGNKEWNNSVNFIEDAVTRYSDWIGEYPYPTVAAVEGPKNLSSGGMEYPMITLITSPDAQKEGLDAVITHEVGHNWFYGILASNEREHPWMDEGLNTYFQFRYEAEKYRSNSVFGSNLPEEVKKLSADEFLARIMFAMNSLPAKLPIQTHSTAFTNKDEYGIVVYLKTAIWMSILEASIGKENLLNGLKQYFKDWKFKHPYPEDLKSSLEKGSNQKLGSLFDLVNKEGNFQ